jgi:hypothetical protein
VSLRTRGVVACTALLAAAACTPDQSSSGPVSIGSPDVGGAARTACRVLLDAVPSELGGQDRRDVDPANALGAAWGDPAIELRCGVGTPEGLTKFSECQEVNGVGWYVPEGQVADASADLTLTTIGFEPAVELRIPARYRPPNDALVELSGPIKKSLKQVKRCV